jgi:hypothetical protein
MAGKAMVDKQRSDASLEEAIVGWSMVCSIDDNVRQRKCYRHYHASFSGSSFGQVNLSRFR